MARIDWNIRARAHSCMKCASAFQEKQTVRSAVLPFEHPLVMELFAEKLAEEAAIKAAGGSVKAHPDYVRLDFCDDCFRALGKVAWLSQWKSQYEPPTVAEAASGFQKETTEALLRRLIEAEDAENYLAPIYLLAVMLERKRILVERGVKNSPNGTRVHIYEHRRSVDILLVADPALTEEQLPEVQMEIERLLGLSAVAPEALPGNAKTEDADVPEVAAAPTAEPASSEN